MLRLQKNQANQKSLPLKVSNYYLFVFTKSSSNYSVIPTVQSTSDRAVDFTIDTTTDDALNGSIILGSGQYSLKVYSKDTQDLDASTGTVIYTSRAFVEIESTFKQFNPTVTTLKQFNP